MQSFQQGDLRIKFMSIILRSESLEITELPPQGLPNISLQILAGQELCYTNMICSCVDAWVQLCQEIRLSISNSSQDKLVVYLHYGQAYLGGAQLNLPTFTSVRQEYNFQNVKLFNANGQQAGEFNINAEWDPTPKGFLDRMSKKIDKSINQISQSEMMQDFSKSASKAAEKTDKFLTKGYEKLKQKFKKKEENKLEPVINSSYTQEVTIQHDVQKQNEEKSTLYPLVQNLEDPQPGKSQ